MKLFAAKLAMFSPALAVLGGVGFTFLASLPSTRLPPETLALLLAGLLSVSAGLVYSWVGVSRFVNRRFGV